MLKALAAPFQAYADWLHLRWPAGVPEALPEVQADGTTNLPGVRVAGNLLGVPLLKFAADSGAKAVRAFVAEGAFSDPGAGDGLDLAIVGGGVAGLSAALEAKRAGLRFRVFESAEPFATVANFTKGKPIYTYPTDMRHAGELKLEANVKESLLADLRGQAEAAGVEFEIRKVDAVRPHAGQLELRFSDTSLSPMHAKRVLLCIGTSGDHRKLGVPGEALEKVHNRLFDPADYAGEDVLVVGGGDSALEAAIALADAGARVHLSYRGSAFSRPKPENVEKAQTLLGARILFGSEVQAIEERSVRLSHQGATLELPNDAVFVLIGRQPPTQFFEKNRIPVRGRWSPVKIVSLIVVLAVVTAIYSWKTDGGTLANVFLENSWFPNNIEPNVFEDTNVVGTILQDEVVKPGFYYELFYTLIILGFGIRRIRRYRTPYVTRQTLSLMGFQTIPLFLLPYLLLPLLGSAGVFDAGAGQWLADQLFPLSGDGQREYWRSVGFILAWPLFVWNVFTPTPNGMWLAISLLQTFVLIPWLVYRYGKGAYCGWICSCGALAETLGDAHRGKMPHGPWTNRLNLAGQIILAVALALLAVRVVAWGAAGSPLGESLEGLFNAALIKFSVLGIPLNYYSVVDYFLAGIVGLGLYFHFSGRTWCRFFCPLAALMHIYARFSQFRIFAEKAKCISCNQCTTVCHQGIDIMNFANKGLPMEDPECVRCSACVHACPTGTLSFGRLTADGRSVPDAWSASPVRMTEQ